MPCTNGYDTIDQDAGVALDNAFVITDDATTDLVRDLPTITSSCRVADGTWIGWFQNYEGDAIETGFGPLPRGNDDKSTWPSRVASAVPIGVGFFPDDGSGPVVYELGLKQPLFEWSDVVLYSSGDPCSREPVLGESFANKFVSILAAWSTDVVDVQVRSDGELVWVAVLARETYPYPYITNRPDTDACRILHPGLREFLNLENGGDYENDDPFVHDTDTGYRWWQHFPGLTGDGEGDDAGESESFRWTPYRLSVYCGDLGGFERIGDVNAVFANHGGWGLTSGIECAASPAEPGVLHVLWAEGGIRDSYRVTYGQRINYSRWDAGGKTLDTDLAYSQTSATHGSPDGDYSSDWVWTAEMIVRNDHGSPIAIVWPWTGSVAYGGLGSFPEFIGPAAPGLAEFWDLSNGSVNVLQTMASDLLPTPAETLGVAVEEDVQLLARNAGGFTVPRRVHHASGLYEDPTLGGQAVYLFNMQLFASGVQCSVFYRIPCDGSSTFSFLDGVREVGYSIVVDALQPGVQSRGTGLIGAMASDFVSDPDDVWIPVAGTSQALQLDRQCLRGWRTWNAFPLSASLPPFHFTDNWGPSVNNVSPPTILSLDSGDWLTQGGYRLANTQGFEVWGGSGDEIDIAAVRAKICRCCEPCDRTGLHVWQVL